MHHTRFSNVTTERNNAIRASCMRCINEASACMAKGERALAREFFLAAAESFELTGFNQEDATWCRNMADSCK